MSTLRAVVSRVTLGIFLVLGSISAPALGSDLSRYRDFPFGTNLPSVAKGAGIATSEAKTIHARPALIQELEWRPQPMGGARQSDSVQTVVCSFYNGQLFAVTVNYDRYETEGLTAADIVEAISAIYGDAERPAPTAKAVRPEFGGGDEIVARWQDSEYRFELVRGSYGPTYRLVGISKKLQADAQAAIAESKRLDDREAPQREAARLAAEKENEQAKLDKSRQVNKPKFRP